MKFAITNTELRNMQLILLMGNNIENVVLTKKYEFKKVHQFLPVIFKQTIGVVYEKLTKGLQ
jgi:hypothetical protein